MDLSTLTIAEARRALDAKEYSAHELTNAYVENIVEIRKRCIRLNQVPPGSGGIPKKPANRAQSGEEPA